MINGPLVSIVLTSYNQPDLLDIAFNSLISQSYKNIEIIIVDDCSINPLNTKLILNYYTSYPSIVRYIFHNHNQGIAKNKNSGFRIARGEFITYLDGDDFYFPEKIDNEIALFLKQPDLDVVYSNFIFAEPSGELTNPWTSQDLPEGYIFKQIVKEEFPETILFRCELIRRKVYEKFNFYDENIKIYHDWDFRIRYGMTSKVGYCNKILSVYRRTSESITIKSSLARMANEKIFVITKNKNLIESNIELKGFYQTSRRKLRLSKLFDNRIGFWKHLKLSTITIFNYPSSVITVLKSINHSQLHKIRKKDL